MSKQRRRRRGKGKHGFLLVFFALVALLLAFVLSSGLFFKITEIRVEGASAYTTQQVRDAAGYDLGENLLLINKVTAIRGIFNTLPYVEQVKIRRELPGTVVIEIVEAAPVAMLENYGSYWLINGSGMLLESVPVLLAPTLPVITGVTLLAPVEGTMMGLSEKDKPKVDALLALLRALIEEDLWSLVSQVDFSSLSNVSFRYDDRFTVALGLPDNLTFKLTYMKAAIATLEPYRKGLLDLSDAENYNARLIPMDE